MNKERIKNILQNCSEKQYDRLKRRPINNISFKHLYNKDDKSYKFAIIRDEYGTIIDLLFLLEEDEEEYFSSAGVFYCRCIPKVGKYYLNKYSFLYEITRKEEYISKFQGCILHQVYNQKGNLVLYWYE